MKNLIELKNLLVKRVTTLASMVKGVEGFRTEFLPWLTNLVDEVEDFENLTSSIEMLREIERELLIKYRDQ